jgi:hypothetical protein
MRQLWALEPDFHCGAIEEEKKARNRFFSRLALSLFSRSFFSSGMKARKKRGRIPQSEFQPNLFQK